MAQFRLSASIIKRSTGRSVTAAAAYRAGCVIECDRYGEQHDYTRRRGILHAEIMAPDNAPDWMRDRAKLWNAVEAAERRNDAQLAREVQLSLPHELTDDQRRDLVRQFVSEQFVSEGMIADVAIHAPGRDGDDRNHHAHILLTMRELTGQGFGNKARSWNDTARLEQWREAWAEIQNRTLERLGISARVDHRSLEAQGIDREPQQHLGPAAAAMEAEGKETRIGRENDRRRAANENRATLHAQALRLRQEIDRERARFAAWSAEKVGQLDGEQALSRLDQARSHELERDGLEAELQAHYGPHLRTVEAEAGAVADRLESRGIRRFWRSLTGRTAADRERLDELRATIKDTRQRMEEMRGQLARRQEAERLALDRRQEDRRKAQQEGLQRAQERKEQTLAAKLAEVASIEARAAQELARGTPHPAKDPYRTRYERKAAEREAKQEQGQTVDRSRKGPEIT
jgi:hypothetical protein